VRDIIARQYRPQHKGGCAKRTIIQSDFFFAKSQSTNFAPCFKEKRHHLHHKSLGKTIENDEEDVVNDVTFGEEVAQHAHQFVEGFGCTHALFGTFSALRKHTRMVQSQ